MFSFIKKWKDNRIIAQTRDNYNRIAVHFARTRNSSWPEFEYFEKYLADGQKLLDWGCGSGRYFRAIKNKKIQYYGVDLSSEIIKCAQIEFQKEVESGRAHFTCSENGELFFPKSFFDIAILIASFHHLPSPETRLALLNKIYSELKTGGVIAISVWNLTSAWAKKKLTKPGWKYLGNNDYIVPWKEKDGTIKASRYYHSFTPDELRGLLEKVGFKIEYLDYAAANRSDDKGGRNLVVVAKKV